MSIEKKKNADNCGTEKSLQQTFDYIAAGGESYSKVPELLGALQHCFEGKNEDHVLHLLDNGANPNDPNAWAVFTMMLTTTNSIVIANKLLDCGLDLNTVYTTNREQGHFTNGDATILDHVYGVRDYLSPKRKKLNELAKSHSVRLSPRRKFIEDLIVLLRSKGAIRASELHPES